MPLLPNCDICGRRLSLRRLLFNLRRTERTVAWQARLVSGAMGEREVRWLCGHCQRAFDSQQRQEQDAATDAAAREAAAPAGSGTAPG